MLRPKGRLRRLAVLASGALLGSTLIVGGTATSALACSNALDVGFTIRSGSLVKGQGSWTKCDTSINRVVITLNRSFWNGSGTYYGEVVHNNNPANFGSWIDNIQKSCSGSGTQQWYVSVKSYDASGNLTGSKISNILTTTC